MIYEYLIMAAMIAGSALVSTTIWSRNKTRVRMLGLVIFIAMLPLLAGSGFMALGHPAPWVSEITVPAGSHDVIAVKLIQDEAIYLWLSIAGEAAPRSYVLPWWAGEAQRLDRLLGKRNQKGQRFMVDVPPQPFNDTRTYHPKPQPRMPDKVIPLSLPPIYERTP